MARDSRSDVRLDSPKGLRSRVLPGRNRQSKDSFGRATESIARGMGTPYFLIALTLFCLVWIAWNVTVPQFLRFDSSDNGFTALTLVLSLQASYAAPLILLAQNRQDDRDRVQVEQDRQRSERNLADTEYLAREVVALRLAIKDMASKDFIRDELRSLLEELDRNRSDDRDRGDASADPAPSTRAPRA
ncbi:DUF1003 domain-containing protein [Frondihabitans cladoniiphilus]|uniref:DUF1003 domain-containing protein n=1 Tax=Frondihabitans cladoniiphilus TaxID=715785 RepID=A0ABP8VRV6_9MICO